jgi:hypothetical protein
MKILDLVAAIFDDCQTPYVYVSAPTVIGGEKRLYDPLLSAMRRIGCYNGFDGRKAADFLRKNLVAENEDGKIIRVCFGRENSPVLYLTLTAYDAKKDRRLTYQERRKQAKDFLALVKEKLEPDDASVLPGCVTLRLWWD